MCLVQKSTLHICPDKVSALHFNRAELCTLKAQAEKRALKARLTEHSAAQMLLLGLPTSDAPL